MQYRVRKGFTLHLNDRPPVSGGSVVELTATEFERYAHQLEPFTEVEPEPVTEVELDTEVIETEAEAEPAEAEPKKRRSRKKDDEE